MLQGNSTVLLKELFINASIVLLLLNIVRRAGLIYLLQSDGDKLNRNEKHIIHNSVSLFRF